MTKSTTPWYIDFFFKDYQEIYAHIFPKERTELEVTFLETLLDLPSKSKILDLCCGQGRHAVVLAKHGFDVTAQDLNPDYLRQAKEHSRLEGVPLRLINEDMRTIPYNAVFDAVINMFSAFGYLESEEENGLVLTAIQHSLKPGGLLIMDLINREWVVRNYDETEWRENQDGTIFLEHRMFDLATSKNHVSFTIIQPDGTRKKTAGHHIRLYSLTEMIHLLNQSGLRLESCFGGFSGEPYSIGAKRMILLARNESSYNDQS